MKHKKFSWKYFSFGIVALGSGILAGTFGHSLIADNDSATNIIVTVFSILAGFLIAVMTLLGDQSVLPGSWRIAEAKMYAIKVQLVRQKWLFYSYLGTLALIFLAALLEKQFPTVVTYIERLYFGLSVTSFCMSFRLPSTLMEVQLERVNAVIEARNAQASRLDRS